MQQAKKPNFDSDFYEDVGDPLAGFRKKHRGGRINKKGKDPFSKDPDVMQAARQDKLQKEIEQQNLLGGY